MKKAVKFGTAAALAFIASAAPASVDGKNRTVSIVNNDDNAIEALYVWPKDTTGFHEDILSEAIPAGSSLSVDFDRGTKDCEFHVLAITHVYGYHETDVNACTASRWVIEHKSNHVE